MCDGCRASVPKHLSLASITLEDAVKVLLLPRDLGQHPWDGQPIVANTGRYVRMRACVTIHCYLDAVVDSPKKTRRMEHTCAILASTYDSLDRSTSRQRILVENQDYTCLHAVKCSFSTSK